LLGSRGGGTGGGRSRGNDHQGHDAVGLAVLVRDKVVSAQELAAGEAKIKHEDLDAIRNICRCGSHTRIREAIAQGARHMR